MASSTIFVFGGVGGACMCAKHLTQHGECNTIPTSSSPTPFPAPPPSHAKNIP